MSNAYYYYIPNEFIKVIWEEPYPYLLQEWNSYHLEEGIDQWEQYGDDIQFRTCGSGGAYAWWQSFQDRYKLPEQHRDPQFIRFGPNSTLPIHRDPKSLAWIAVTVVGDQAIEFYDMNEMKLHEVKYKFALVNSKQPHYCDVNGEERVLFRKIYTETSYDTLFQLLN